MGTGSLITGEQQLSKSNYNHKFILADTGTVIEAMASIDKFDGMTCSPTADGSTLKKGRLYVWHAGDAAWKDQANPLHTHSSVDQGGLLKDILIANDPYLWKITDTDLIYQSSSGSAPIFANTISGTDAYRSIATAASANSAGTYVAGGLRYDMAFKLYAHFRATMTSATTSYTTRAGFNMEHAHVSAGAAKKLGIEACDACNGVNLRVVSADGTTRSAANTSDDSSVEAVYKLIFDPSIPNLSYFKNNGSATIKSSNMPTSGTPDRSNAFIMGIMTTTGTARTMKIQGLRAYGTMSSDSSQWV